jgi:hypothetical protein
LASINEGDRLSIVDGEIFAMASWSRAARCSPRPRSRRDGDGARRDRRRARTLCKNTLEYIRREAQLTFEPIELRRCTTVFQGRHALVVVRCHDCKATSPLRPYIREYRPSSSASTAVLARSSTSA